MVYRASLCAHADAASTLPFRAAVSEPIPCGTPLSKLFYTNATRFGAEGCLHSDLSPCTDADDEGFLAPAPPASAGAHGQRPAGAAEAGDAGPPAAVGAADEGGGNNPAAAGEQQEEALLEEEDDPYEN